MAAGLAGVGVWAGLGAVVPGRQGSATAVVTRGHLGAGHRLTAADLDVVRLDPSLLPDAVLTDVNSAAGATLGQSVGAGEMLTSTRLRPARALTGLPQGHRAVHLPIADPGSTALVRPGDRVDVVALDTGALVGSDVLVLAVDAADAPAAQGGGLGAGSGDAAGGLVVAAPAGQLARLVPAAARPSGDGVHLLLRPEAAPPNGGSTAGR